MTELNIQIVVSMTTYQDTEVSEKLGSASYAWILAYFNDISDGYSCYQGQILAIPKSLYSLFNDGEVLQTVSPFALNLGAE